MVHNTLGATQEAHPSQLFSIKRARSLFLMCLLKLSRLGPFLSSAFSLDLRSITINFCQGLDIISQERDLILFGVSPLTENTCILRRSSSHIRLHSTHKRNHKEKVPLFFFLAVTPVHSNIVLLRLYLYFIYHREPRFLA